MFGKAKTPLTQPSQVSGELLRPIVQTFNIFMRLEKRNPVTAQAEAHERGDGSSAASCTNPWLVLYCGAHPKVEEVRGICREPCWKGGFICCSRCGVRVYALKIPGSSCSLLWSSRPTVPLPLLFCPPSPLFPVVKNNNMIFPSNLDETRARHLAVPLRLIPANQRQFRYPEPKSLRFGSVTTVGMRAPDRGLSFFFVAFCRGVLLYLYTICILVIIPPTPYLSFLQAIATTCDELRVQWKKEYFGTW